MRIESYILNYIKRKIMIKQVFINLPVKDLSKSVDFFTKLGFKFNERFTDEKATCMIVTDTIYVMLLTESFFNGFTQKEVADTSAQSEVILAFTVESSQQVDEIIEKAIAAGGTKKYEVKMEGMFSKAFADLDGHIWEILWMDETKMP